MAENADFVDYVDGIARAEEAAQRRQDMFAAHEEWRQTTWGGFAVRQIQALTSHFRPFLEEAMEVMSDDSSYTQLIVYNVIRLLVIFICVGVVYALAKVLQTLIGKELVIEEEVVIVHEHGSKEEAEQAQRGQPAPRRSARDKSKSE